MDCLNPIRITSPAKYISPYFGDSFINFVRCGRCANCQDSLSREWYFRAFYEYLDTVNKGGYMLMDCLTYSEKYVPRVSRYFRATRQDGKYLRLPRKLDFRCFDYRDLRLFFVRLRRSLEYKGFDIAKSLRYFAACEYGTDSNCSHRPHIHILFYVTTPNLDNLTLSRAISAAWHFGRTDGIPYKSARYVNDYTISKGLSSSQRACKYVSKYVMKSSDFQKTIDKRLASIMHYLYDQRFTQYHFENSRWSFDGIRHDDIIADFDYSGFESFCSSEGGKKLYRDLRRQLDQYHRQSLGFGASAIDTFDMASIMDTNLVTIPDEKQIVMRLGLPMYYKRKLFYEQVEIDGVKYWQLNQKGLEYRKRRKLDSLQRLQNDYECAKVNYGLDLPAKELADYVVNRRGRIDALFPDESTVTDRVNSPLVLYNYNTSSDKRHFHCRFLTHDYLGNNKLYCEDDEPFDYIPVESFIRDCVIIDDYYESFLSQLADKRAAECQGKQKLHDNRQRLNQVYKQLSLL